MPYVVTERCVNSKYTDCAAVCPVQCIYEIDDPAMVVIDPDVCIDCHLCVAECPVHAIYADHEVPEPYKSWINRNRELVPRGRNLTEEREALPGALTLDQVQELERQRGWDVLEPADS